jgi:Domain of unknown function (DUF4440)
MKRKLLLLILLVLILSEYSFSQSKKELAVAAKVELLRKAIVDADSLLLDKLAVEQLSYGHSSGKIENKAAFISNIISGKSDFVSIELTNQSISVLGKTAIVRHKLDAVTNNDGKPGEVHLLILLVWQKLHGEWMLLARQAAKQQ